MILPSSLLFSSLELAQRHPGLVMVLLGVAGEVICDWKEMGRRLACAKKVSAILLILGLIIEFVEAAKSDKDVSASMVRAADAKLLATQLSLRVEELRQKNDAFELQMAPRVFRDQFGAAGRLSKYAGMRAVIFFNPEARCANLAGQICFVLKEARWNVQSILPTLVTASGVKLSAARYGINGEEVSEAEQIEDADEMLVDELNRSDIDAFSGASLDNTPFRGILIEVGPKPSADEAEEMSINRKMRDPNGNLSVQEMDALFKQESELFKKEEGSSSNAEINVLGNISMTPSPSPSPSPSPQPPSK